MLVHDLADLWAGALPGLPGTPQEELVGPPSRGSLTLGCHSSLRLRGDGCQCDSVGQPVRPLPSAGACPGCGRRWPPGAARGPAHRALGETQPCRPSALGRRGPLHSSVSFLGLSSLPLPRERTGADQTALCCCSGPTLLSVLPLCLPVCPRPLPFCIRFAGRCRPRGARGGRARWKPSSWSFD